MSSEIVYADNSVSYTQVVLLKDNLYCDKATEQILSLWSPIIIIEELFCVVNIIKGQLVL